MVVREVLTRKKKSVNFHTFGSDPPPKKCETYEKFFFHTLTETYFGEKSFKENIFFHLETQKT